MTENYCGRSCQGCVYKDTLECPGCESWAKGDMNASCEVVSCCRIRMQDSCVTCSSKDVCEKFDRHKTTPNYILEELRSNINRENFTENNSIIAQRMKVLFWLYIVSMGIELLFDFILGGLWQIFDIIGSIATAACSITYAVVLLKMAKINRGYKVAGICGIIAGTRSLALIMPASNEWILSLALSALIIGFVISFVSEFKEYYAHAELVEGYSEKLAGYWRSLWISTIVATVMRTIDLFSDSSSIYLALILLFVIVLKYICLKRTYELFVDRSYFYDKY